MILRAEDQSVWDLAVVLQLNIRLVNLEFSYEFSSGSTGSNIWDHADMTLS